MQRSTSQFNRPDEMSAARELAGLADLHRQSSIAGDESISSALLSPIQTRVVNTIPRPPAPKATNRVFPLRTLKDAKKYFPAILFGILENPECRDIITWLPGGKAFVLLDETRFVTDILPTYFKNWQFPRFRRILKRWQFVRVPKCRLSGAFYHNFFRRNSKCLCELMSCDDKAPQDLSSLFAKVSTWQQESSLRECSFDEYRRPQSPLALEHIYLEELLTTRNSRVMSQAAVTNLFSHQRGRINTSSSNASHPPYTLDSSHLRALNVLRGLLASAPQFYPTHITTCDQTNQHSTV